MPISRPHTWGCSFLEEANNGMEVGKKKKPTGRVDRTCWDRQDSLSLRFSLQDWAARIQDFPWEATPCLDYHLPRSPSCPWSPHGTGLRDSGQHPGLLRVPLHTYPGSPPQVLPSQPRPQHFALSPHP